MPRPAWLTAAAMTLIRTSPSAGCLTGRVCGRRAAPGPTRSVAITRIVVMVPTVGSAGPVVVDRDQSPSDPAQRLGCDTDVRRDLALGQPGREGTVVGEELPVPRGRVGQQELTLPLFDTKVELLGEPGDEPLPARVRRDHRVVPGPRGDHELGRLERLDRELRGLLAQRRAVGADQLALGAESHRAF